MLYLKELGQSKELKGANKHDSCRRTHRSLDKGGYARLQLPWSLVSSWPSDHPALEGIDISNWGNAKTRFKVMVHHLAFRYKHNQIIPDEKDVMHLCGKGKAAVKDDPCMGCISGSCMGIGTHKENMSAQGCLGTVQCQFCKLITNACTHPVTCKTGFPISEGVKSVTVTFNDGSIKTYTCS